MTTEVLHLADRDTDSFQRERLVVDVVCAGDSLTGWNNDGPMAHWPYPCYPQFLQESCRPLGLRIANGGIAGEISHNGIAQVRDYLELFPNARYFVIGYGTNDLGMADICSNLRDEHFADELHPNEAGAKIIAEEIVKVLRTVHAG